MSLFPTNLNYIISENHFPARVYKLSTNFGIIRSFKIELTSPVCPQVVLWQAPEPRKEAHERLHGVGTGSKAQARGSVPPATQRSAEQDPGPTLEVSDYIFLQWKPNVVLIREDMYLSRFIVI